MQRGLLLVDKPVGPSSFAVVRELRRRYGTKAGHAGTLDPLASGLLLVLLGHATRLARYLVGLDKRYATTIRLGERTATGDAEGDVVERPGLPPDIGEALAGLTGEVDLHVPAASAVKIAGERAYRLHRQRVPAEMPVRRMTIHGLEVVRFQPPDLVLTMHVGSGTYVRSIADALGGHCLTLRRTAVGPFRVEDADSARVLAPRDALPFLPERVLAPGELAHVRSGRAIPLPGSGLTRLVHDGELVGIARLEDGLAHPETVLAPLS